MKAVILNANIRGCEVGTNKNGDEYILVHYEDDSGRAETVVDKDMSRQDLYKRDTTADITIDIKQGRQYTNIRVADVNIHEG